MHLGGLRNILGSFPGFAVDTTCVVFFLGLELGRTLRNLTFDTFLMFGTVLIVAVLPYYLPSDNGRPAFAKWLTGSFLIAVFAIALGAFLVPTYGTVFPESFRFLPLTLLILTSMTSCIIRFYALMRLRPAK